MDYNQTEIQTRKAQEIVLHYVRYNENIQGKFRGQLAPIEEPRSITYWFSPSVTPNLRHCSIRHNLKYTSSSSTT